MPLHKFYLNSDLITGFVELGTIDQLPFGSVSLLLGNDLAGDKVKPSGCIVVDKPQEDVTDNLGLDETLTSCVVTRAMKLADNNKNESVLDTDTDTNKNSIALADTFMSHDVDRNNSSKTLSSSMNPSSQMYQTGLMLQYMILMLVTVSPSSSNILTKWALLR